MGAMLLAVAMAASGRAGEAAERSRAEAGKQPAAPPEPTPAPPARYILNYPAAERFYPPIQGFFDEAARTSDKVRGRRVTRFPNGGYGRQTDEQDVGGGRLHVGADMGWHRPRAPVYAVAAGVVRQSLGPVSLAAEDNAEEKSERGPETKGLKPEAAPVPPSWGNLVVIEHRLPSGEYVTSIYGHLGSNRLVKQGDVVAASQQIGTIGEKDPAINGGFEPHLHFGLHQGRMAEPGCTLGDLYLVGRAIPVQLVDVAEDRIEIKIGAGLRLGYLTRAGRRYPVTVRDGKSYVSAQVLWDVRNRPGFEVAGYADTTEGWLDPVAFLRKHGAARNPAPPRAHKPEPAGKP
jgi:murein DD-endopeptidase MepM/ murein hydrolase activator NlpD